MSDRCEPPPELRGVDGWHWVQRTSDPPVVLWWVPGIQGFDGRWLTYGGNQLLPFSMAEDGWRYVAPVATPDEVEALRAERDAARTAAAVARGHVAANDVVIATLRARVSKMEGALRGIAGRAGQPNTYVNEQLYIAIELARHALGETT